MRKFLIFLLLGAMVLSLLGGCSLRLERPQTVSRETMAALQSAFAPQPAPEPEPEPVPQPEPLPQPEPEPLPPPTGEELRLQRAQELLAGMTVEQQVGQLFFAHCPGPYGEGEDLMARLQLGGYLLFKRDYQDKGGQWLSADAFAARLKGYRDAAAIAPFFGTDEEGGQVVRASQNPNLFPQGESPAPQKLYEQGGMEAVLEDVKTKSETLLSHGINVNFGPVADVCSSKRDYMYHRTLGQDAATTADYVAQTVAQMNESGVGAVLKHFPGYGSSRDTHTGIVTDTRPLEQFVQQDLLPFQAGVQAGTAAVLVSHNIVTCLDDSLPASLSPAVYRLLREDVGFDGVAITDDLTMDAVNRYTKGGNAAVLALQAGADMILTSHPEEEVPQVLAAVENGVISAERLQQSVLRVLLWKLELGVIA